MTEQTDFTRFAFIRHDHDFFTGIRHFGQALDLDRNRRTGFGNALAVFVQHRTDTTISRTSQHDVAALEGTGLHQDRSDRATTFVELGFNHQATCRCIHRCFQFQHFSLQQYLFEQGINALAGFRRHRYEWRIATVFFRHNLFCDQFLGNAISIRTRLVHFVDSHDQRHARCFRMRNCFLGLRHHAVVSRHHQDHDIGCFRTACTHRRKCFMAWRIEEGDHAARCFHVVCADVLGNAARFAGCNLGATDVIQQRSFTVIDVTHDGHNRCAWQGFDIGVLFTLLQQGFRIVQFRRVCRVAHFFDQNHCCFLIEHLVDRAHLAQFHQMLDDFGCLDRHFVREFGNGNRFRYVHVFYNGFGWCLEVAFTIVMMRWTTALRTCAPAITATAGVAAGLDAGTAFFRVVLPGGRDIRRFDRFLVCRYRWLFLVFLLAGFFISRFVQCTFSRLGCDRSCRLRCLDGATRRIHHGFDLRYFIGYRFTCCFGGDRFFVRFLGGILGQLRCFLFAFFCGDAFFLFLRRFVRFRFNRFCRVCFLRFCFSLFRLLQGFCLRFFFRFQLGQALLFFAQVSFLTRDQLGLTASFFGTTFDFRFVDNWCCRFGWCFFRCGFVAFYESPFFTHFDLDRARFAGGIRLLDFSRFFTGQCDFFLFTVWCNTVRTAQVVKELVLVGLG
ncbi:hypothetical protein D3C85_76270 [compost metagenome]